MHNSDLVSILSQDRQLSSLNLMTLYRLCELQNLGYVYTVSDTFRSVLDRIHSVYTGPVLNWNGTFPHRVTLHKWTHGTR